MVCCCGCHKLRFVSVVRHFLSSEKNGLPFVRSSGECHYLSYGVYNGPIAETANVFRVGAVAENNVSLKKLKKIISTGNPVIAWVNIDENFGEWTFSGHWYDYETGEEVHWPVGEHAVVVYGYDEDNFYISNPYNGEKYTLTEEAFNHNYYDLRERVVYYKN